MIRIHEHEHETQRGRSDGRTGYRERRTISDVIRDLRDETFLLVRQEVALARTEMSEKASTYVRIAAYLGAGAAIAFAGFLVLLGAATAGVFIALVEAGLQANISLWLAPLIVGVVVGLVGYIFVHKAITTLRSESPVPKRTVRSLKEDKQWLKRSMT